MQAVFEGVKTQDRRLIERGVYPRGGGEVVFLVADEDAPLPRCRGEGLVRDLWEVEDLRSLLTRQPRERGERGERGERR